jgi:hypothetical protein
MSLSKLIITKNPSQKIENMALSKEELASSSFFVSPKNIKFASYLKFRRK